MNINDLTIGQAKELASMFGAPAAKAFTPHIGKRCIVRTYASGVFCAEVVAQDGRMLELKNSRRLWSWKASDGISLSAVAVVGVDSGDAWELVKKACTDRRTELAPQAPQTVQTVQQP